MPKKWILTAVSRDGQKVSPTGASSDSVAVHSKADLNRRLKAAKTDPRNLHVTVREED